jgi:hypothetical protein
MGKKKQDKQNRSEAAMYPLDYKPLQKALRHTVEWALDVGAAISREFPDGSSAVERVRAFMDARMAGEPAHLRVDDVLFTLRLVIGALGRDLRFGRAAAQSEITNG